MKSPKLNEKQESELYNVVYLNKHSSREVKRAQAIILIDKGIDTPTITNLTGLGRSQIFNLRSNYLKIGLAAVEDKDKKNPKELLTKKQRAAIIEAISTKKPGECDRYFDRNEYWTTGILGKYILRKYEVAYKSKTSLYLIFRQSKFTFHKPGRVYQKRDENEVKKWRKTAKLIVEQAWREPNTVILCEDEMVLSTQTTFQKIWLPKGEYPKIEASNKKENRSIYGFLNAMTGTEHAFKTEWQNMYITAKILKNIRKIYPNQKILLLWDGPGWHKGKEVIKFIEQDKRIEILHFPKYSPEENPQEHVWKKGRSNVTHNITIDDIDETANKFVKYLNTTMFKYSLLGLTG
jgi:transposase